MRANFVLSGVAAGIRRNAAMTIALVLSTSIALAFVGAAILANTEITKFKAKYEDKINVSVYLCAQLHTGDPNCKHKTTPAETAALQQMFAADPMVKSASYVSEQEAYQRGKEQLQGTTGDFLHPGDLPASFTVKLKDLQKDYSAFHDKYSSVTGVGRVNNQIDTINTLLNIIDSARWFSIVIALLVLLASVLLIANTIQVAAAQRKTEKQRQEHEALAARIEGITLTFAVRVGRGDRLYGSVTSQDIANALVEQEQLSIDRRIIQLREPLRQLGMFEIGLRIAPQMEPKLKVSIIPGEGSHVGEETAVATE